MGSTNPDDGFREDDGAMNSIGVTTAAEGCIGTGAGLGFGYGWENDAAETGKEMDGRFNSGGRCCCCPDERTGRNNCGGLESDGGATGSGGLGTSIGFPMETGDGDG